MSHQSDKTEKTVDLSIIIVSWNTVDLVRGCLLSIKEFTKKYTYEIWVVDNNSSDNTVEMIYEEFPDVRVIANKNNPGFARANNQAFARTNGEFVALLNPDTKLLNNIFEMMIDFLKSKPEYGAVGPRLIGKDGLIQYSCARRFPDIYSEILNAIFWRNIPKSLDYEYIGNWDHEDSRDTEAMSGACMVVKRDLFDDTILHEIYFMYGEDLELCWDIQHSLGKKLYYMSEAHLLHYGNESGKKARDISVEGSHSMYLFLKRTRGLPVALISRGLRFLGALLRVPLVLFRAILGKSRNQDYFRNQIKVIKWALYLNHDAGKTRNT